MQRFRPRDAVFADAAPDGPTIAFPPDGAEVESPDGLVLVKVRDGRAPFLWLANGRPIATGERGRETPLALGQQGFYRLSVIDAAGRSAAVTVRVR